MADQHQSDVLGGLPRTRPQRRSTKRPARASSAASLPASPAEPSQAPRRQAKATSPTPPSRRQAKAASPTQRQAKASAAPAGQRRTGTQPTPLSKAQSRPRSAAGVSKPGVRSKARADRLAQPPQPRGIPSQPRSPVPSRTERPEILGTVVQAAAELTEIGLSLGAQVLRRAVARLPRP